MRIFNTKIDLFTAGVILFILITIHNTSQYGASLSWMLPGCIMIIIGYSFNQNKRNVSTPIALICFWFVIFCSTALSSVVPLEQNIISFAVLLYTFYLVTKIHFDDKTIRTIINVYIVSSLICSVFIIRNWLNGDFYISWTLRASYRFMGEYKDPNYVTAYICPAVFFLFIKSIYTQTFKKKIITFLCLLISIIAILCTGSRSPVLTTALSIGVFYILDTEISINKKLVILLVSSVILYGLYHIYTIIMPDQVFERIENSSNDSRLALWTAGIKGFTENPLIGCGFASGNYYSIKLVGNHCHNVFIDLLSSCGIIGVMFFIFVVVNNCTKSSRSNRKFIFATALSFFVPLFFINGYNSASFITPLMLMSILSNYCRLNKKHFYNLFVNRDM